MIFINSNSVYQIPSKLTSLMNPCLESTDAAPEVSYPHSTRDAVARMSHRVCVFFFFFSRIRTDSARFAPNWADSAKIQPYWPYCVVSAGGRYCRNRPENGRNTPEIGLEYGRKIRNLHSSFFFCESWHSMCFLKIF